MWIGHLNAIGKDPRWEDIPNSRGANRRSPSCSENNWLWDQDTLRSTSSKFEHVREVTKTCLLDEELRSKLTAKLPTIPETWCSDSRMVVMAPSLIALGRKAVPPIVPKPFVCHGKNRVVGQVCLSSSSRYSSKINFLSISCFRFNLAIFIIF